jgi:hypothetical protein
MKKAGISGLEIVIKICQSFTSRKAALSDWHIRFKANKITGNRMDQTIPAGGTLSGKPAFNI